MSDSHETDARAVPSLEGTARAVLRESWERNAAAWTSAVREQKIPSRRLATDAAIVQACLDVLGDARSPRVLDVGCGEGWLSRALAEHGAEVLGIDASEALIARCRPERSTGQPENREGSAVPGSAVYEVCSYEELRSDPARAPGRFDLIVCNFALLDERVADTLAALQSRITARSGRIIVHTVHPWLAAGDGPYEDGWRVETFATFEQPFPSHMPWYFRTLGSWLASAKAAGLRVAELREPLHPETRKPLSLLLILAPE